MGPRGGSPLALGACLALGAVDLGALNLWLVPRALGTGPAAAAPSSPGPALARPPVPARVADGREEPPAAVHIWFGTNVHALGAADGAVVDRLAAVLLRHRDWRVTVTGHADRRGEDARNLTLSARRARAVAARLQGGGIDAGRVLVEALGSSRPLDRGTGPAALQRNRRAEVEVRAGEVRR